MRVWERRLVRGDLFLDVGANVGTYSVLCAALGAEVIAFEPAPDTAHLLRENVALNGFSIEVIQAAAGSERGETAFTRGRDAVNRRDPLGEATVPVVTLDSVVGARRVAGIKVDVEGFELDVLQGLKVALEERRVDLLQLEWNAAGDRSPVAALLSKYGYCLWEPTAEGGLVQAEAPATGDDLFAAPKGAGLGAGVVGASGAGTAAGERNQAVGVGALRDVVAGGRPQRLLVVATHPIQYQAPLYRWLAVSERVDLRVAFLSDFGVAASFDPGFARRIAYDTPLTEGYEHTFLSTGRVKHPGRLALPPPGLVRLLSAERCDAVVVHGYSTTAAWATCLIARARGVPYLMRGETRFETDQARPAWRRRLKHMVLGPLLRRAGACLAIGSSNSRFYLSYGVVPERIVVAPYSVDTDFFASRGADGHERREVMLRTIGLDPGLATICFAAKLQAHKRPLDLIAAVAEMRRPANLLLIGDGPLRSEVEAEVRRLPSAHLLGFVNQSKIGQWYGASEVIVLPSSHEPWGLVVNEAMAAGATPVLSSAVGCGPDLVRSGHGAIFPVGDVSALTEALDTVLAGLADPEGRTEARLKSQAISAEFSIAATGEGFEQAAGVACDGR